jgi:hypothetical protein
MFHRNQELFSLYGRLLEHEGDTLLLSGAQVTLYDDLPSDHLNSFMEWFLQKVIILPVLITVHLVDQKQQKRMEMRGLTSSQLHQVIYTSVSCGL